MRFTQHLFMALLCAIVSPLYSQNSLWTVLAESELSARSAERWIVPEKYKTLALDLQSIRFKLDRVPLRFNALEESATIELPMPDGHFEHFAIVEAPLMEPELAARYPDIRTFSGQGITDTAAAVYLDWTPQGFHAMILQPGSIYYIDPYYKEDNTIYVCYDRSDYFDENAHHFNCEANDAADISHVPSIAMEPVTAGSRAAVTLRTYNIAMAATGEYTSYHGGTVPLALAAINTTLNRVRGIYETELAISFTLNSNNSAIIYTSTATDPYSNPPTLAENQANIDLVIGSANYHVGHVVGMGSGGMATLNGVCDNSKKARGMTASAHPKTDAFDVDFVAHELGHQLGAHHTFNGGITGSCSASNYHSSTAYEPGSGSTIMSYAGLCGSQNLQRRSNAYFHAASLNEIRTYTTSGTGSTCGTSVGTSNNTPTVNADPNGLDGKTIPISTPFELTASGSDADWDALTYVWEQLDLGPQGAPNAASTTAPSFRSYTPTSNPKRTFPILGDILDNTTSVGDKLPSVTRDLNFGCIVRDNKAAGGGYATDAILLHVTSAAGPFRITSHNTTSMVNGDITVTWDVAGTTAAPVSCANVDLQISLDGGSTFTDLAVATPNDGSQLVTLPNTTTSTARLRVKCSDNVFFDINNADLRIAPVGASCGEGLTSATMESNNGWTQTSASGLAPFIANNWSSYGGPASHSGSGYAWLGYDNNETARISQTVSIPVGSHFATLEFWYRYGLTDCSGDVFNVKINGSVVKSYNFCNDAGAHDWTRQLVNLAPYIGTSPTILFEVVSNAIYPSDVFIDDVSVYTCSGGAFSLLPVDFVAFEAKAMQRDAVLSWTTASEVNNRGFEVEMQVENADFRSVGFVPGHGTTSELKDYGFTVPNLPPGHYYFRLHQIDESGSGTYSPVRHVFISVAAHVAVQPNPATETAHFALSLEEAGAVRLEILDRLGRVVGTVANDQYTNGRFDLAYDLKDLPDGVYYYRLSAGHAMETGKFVVAK